MESRTFLYQTLLGAMVFSCATLFINGFDFPETIANKLLVLLAIGALMALAPQLIKFFALESAFLTVWLSVTIMCVIGIFVADRIFADFATTTFFVDSKSLSNIITINALNLVGWQIITISSIITGLFSAIISSIYNPNSY